MIIVLNEIGDKYIHWGVPDMAIKILENRSIHKSIRDIYIFRF